MTAKSTKTLSAAEQFIKERRMRYAEMYPTDFHLMLRLVSSRDEFWDKDGKIVCDYHESPGENALTEEGWKSFENVQRCPTSWPEPYLQGPIFNIPDNADESWLQAISMFVYHLEKWNPAHVETWITTAARLTGMGADYQEAAIARNIRGYRAVHNAIVEQKVSQRIALIRAEWIKPKTETPPVVEVGATVRFFTGVETSVVETITTTPLSRYSQASGHHRLVTLREAINGSKIHLFENLVVVEPQISKATE